MERCSTLDLITTSGATSSRSATRSTTGWRKKRARRLTQPHAITSGHSALVLHGFLESKLGLDILDLKVQCRDLIRIRPSASAFLRELEASHVRVVLVTNAPPETIDLKMEETGIRAHFDRIISSHEFGYPKEDAAFWQRLRVTEPFTPEKTLFIDDNLSVLRAAKEYGIAHLLAVPNPDSGRAPTSTEEFTSLTP